MDNKQILEEIDIIVRAKVEEAREDIKRVARETAKMVNAVSNEMKSLSNNNDLHEFFKGAKESMDAMFNSAGFIELKKQMQELSKEKEALAKKLVFDTAMFTEEDSKRLDDIVLKMYEVENALKSIPKENNISINTSENTTTSNNSVSNIDMGTSINELQKAKEEVYSLEERLNNFDFSTLREQIKTLAMQFGQLFPAVNATVQEFKQRIGDTDSLLGVLAKAFKHLWSEAKNTTSKISSAFLNVKTNISNTFTKVFDTVKAKISPYGNLFKNAAKIAKNSFIQASTSIKEFASKFSKPIGKIKEFINRLKGIGKESDKQKKKGKDFGSSFGKGLEKGIGSIKKFVLSLLSIRTAFSAISKASQAYLSFDKQLSDSIQNSWNVLGSLLAPMLEYVAGLFSKLVSGVAQFVKVLTGVDLVAKANAKSLDKQAKSAKSAGGALSSIDDISVLNSDSGSGSSEETASIKVEDIDLSPFDSFFAKVSELFSKIFEPFRLSWENVGSGVIDSIGSAVSGLGELGSTVMGSLFEVWTNGTGQEIVENCLIQWQMIFDIIGAVAGAFQNAWKNADSGTNIIQHIADIFKDIQKFVNLILDSILKWVISDGFQTALDRVFKFIDDIFGIVKDICDWLLDMYQTYLKPVIDDKLLPAIDDIIIAISDIWNTVKPVIDFIIGYIKAFLEPIIQGLCNFIGGIIDIIHGIAQYISGVFTGDWKKAWEGVKKIFQGIWESISAIVKVPINGFLSCWEFLINKVISGINFFVRALNKLSFDIPDWIPVIGGKTWGFRLKEFNEIALPRLATGNVAYEKTYAIFGEYANARQNPEITSPVSIMEETFDRVLSNHEDTGTKVDKLIVNVANENFYEGTVDYINNENARRGVNIIKEV